MKKFLLILVLIFFFASLEIIVVSAQETQPQRQEEFNITNVLTWLSSDPPNFILGVVYAGLGFTGAIIAIFFMVGGVIPGTAGQARIDADLHRLDLYKERLIELIHQNPPDTAAIDSIGNRKDKMSSRLLKDKMLQFLIAGTLYVIAGSLLAAIFAQDFIQAIAIGLGWTSFMGIFGLKKDYSVRRERKNSVIEKYMERVKILEEKLRKEKIWREEWKIEELEILMLEAEQAKRL
jgi:Trk-type K+ transport system membrane component